MFVFSPCWAVWLLIFTNRKIKSTFLIDLYCLNLRSRNGMFHMDPMDGAESTCLVWFVTCLGMTRLNFPTAPTTQVLLCAASQHLSKCTCTFSRYSSLEWNSGNFLPHEWFLHPYIVLFFDFSSVFWSVLVQWVLGGIKYNFHCIQSSSHPESGLAFCQMRWLREVQSKLQRWMQRFLKSPGAASSFLQGSTVGTSRGALQLPMVHDPSWMTHLGRFVPPTPQTHPWLQFCPDTSTECFHYLLKFLFYMRSTFWAKVNGVCKTLSTFSFRSSICAFWT